MTIRSMNYLPDIMEMKCFLAVAEELHFGRAAIRLNMTQPTISQYIRKIEGQMGVPLFKRTTRSVELTECGNAFQAQARQILRMLEDAVLHTKLASGGISPGGEHLSIGMIEPAVYRLFPRILRRFRKRFPATKLTVRTYDSAAIVRAIEQGDCDVGIMRQPTNGNLVRFEPLMSQRFVAVIPKGSPLASRTELVLADFKGHNVFILKRFELSRFQDVFDKVVAAGILVDSHVKVSNTASALATAAAGVGITFLPQWVESIADDDVVLRKVSDLPIEIPIGLGWLKDSPVPGIIPFLDCATFISDPDRPRGSQDEFAHLRSSEV